VFAARDANGQLQAYDAARDAQIAGDGELLIGAGVIARALKDSVG